MTASQTVEWNSEQEDQKEQECHLRNRNHSKSIESKTTIVKENKKTQDPIQWFSALPPSCLSEAQKQFKLGISFI